MQSRYYDPEVGRFINADSFASTGQGLLGFNMFAYCRSNPVIRKDATGTDDICVTTDDDNPFDDLGIPGLGCGGGAGGGMVATVAGIAAGGIAVAGITITSTTTKVADKTFKRNNSVYVLIDGTNTVQYVGRTCNVERRRIAHGANPARAGLQMQVIASGLDLLEAKALEQAAMAYYHTINTENKMNNQINSIAPKYWAAYKELARGVLDYGWNQMSNEILYWTEN